VQNAASLLLLRCYLLPVLPKATYIQQFSKKLISHNLSVVFSFRMLP